LDDIDKVLRPILAEGGFALSFDTQPIEGNRVRILCRLSHKDGHFETKQIDLPIDNSGSKNGAQAVGSTVSYGRRMLTKMFFNIVEKGEDNNAETSEKLTEDQLKDLEAAMTEVPLNKKKFLEFMGVNDVHDILQRDLKKALNAIDTKRRQVK